jgi:hypothetical protein
LREPTFGFQPRSKVEDVKVVLLPETLSNQKGFNKEIAPSRFELESYDPESQMMDLYTKGLCVRVASSHSYFKPTDK